MNYSSSIIEHNEKVYKGHKALEPILLIIGVLFCGIGGAVSYYYYDKELFVDLLLNVSLYSSALAFIVFLVCLPTFSKIYRKNLAEDELLDLERKGVWTRHSGKIEILCAIVLGVTGFIFGVPATILASGVGFIFTSFLYYFARNIFKLFGNGK